MKTLEELSLLELLALHSNYWQTKMGVGARYAVLADFQFEAVEKELDKRLNKINFKTK